MKRLALSIFALLAGSSALANSGFAIVMQDQVPLRSAPRASASSNAVLWQGETLEVRAERLDYLQVYDYRRERGGYVRASQVWRLAMKEEEAPELLSILRYLRAAPGSEALGIAFAAAYIEASPPGVLGGDAGIEALDALGTLAHRLARRASSPTQKSQAALSAHLELAARYGVRFVTQEREGRMQICYDGGAFRRLLAMRSSALQRARAALALTLQDCLPGELHPRERRQLDEWRVEVLDQADAGALPVHVRNRLLMRRAVVWASLAYQRARLGEPADAAATRALQALAGVNKSELAEEDLPVYADAAMRVSASRWAGIPAPIPVPGPRPSIMTVDGEPGETCVLLVDAKNGVANPLARRCTYSLVWPASATLNREGTALAVAVQPTDAWRELWLFHKSASGWRVQVLPPPGSGPGVGYAEFAGWVPGVGQVLVAREAAGKRRFEQLKVGTLAAVRQATDPSAIPAFQRWQDPAWKGRTLSLR